LSLGSRGPRRFAQSQPVRPRTDWQHGEPVHREMAGRPRAGQRGIPPRQPSNREKSLILTRRREPPLLCMFSEPVEPPRYA
jgi:hypothetical protein